MAQDYERAIFLTREFVIHLNPIGFNEHRFSLPLRFEKLQCLWSSRRRTDLVPGRHDLSTLVDEKRGADDPLDRFTIHRLLPPGPISFGNLVISV